jgi:hypothetical protein
MNPALFGEGDGQGWALLGILHNILGNGWEIKWPNGTGYYAIFLHVHDRKSSLFLGFGIMTVVHLGYNNTVGEENKWQESALSWA